MKQLILITLMSLLIGAAAATPALAGRQVELGAIFGPRVSAFYGEDRDMVFGGDWEGIGRSLGGVFARFDLNRYFSVVPQLTYSKKGCRFFHTNTDDDTVSTYIYNIRLEYIEVPVLLRFKPHVHTNLNPYFIAGPSIALGVSGDLEARFVQRTSTGETIVDEQTLDRRNIYNIADIQFGLNVGIGVDCQIGQYGFAVEGLYSADLNNAFASTSGYEETPEGETSLVHPDGVAFKLKNRTLSLMFMLSYTLEI